MIAQRDGRPRGTVDAGRRPAPALAASPGWTERRDRVEAYFDRTAAETWRKLTSEAAGDVKVGRVRATVRAGRETMRATLLSWLPEDLTGVRVLDVGCGPGVASIELAKAGATVVGVDLSATLIGHARERAAQAGIGAGPLDLRFLAGDALDPAVLARAEELAGGRFAHALVMDCLIHYPAAQAAAALAALAGRVERSVLFTHAPKTPALAVMHALGKLFPKGERSPAIEPVAEAALRAAFERLPGSRGWAWGRGQRVDSGFYVSRAQELTRSETAAGQRAGLAWPEPADRLTRSETVIRASGRASPDPARSDRLRSRP